MAELSPEKRWARAGDVGRWALIGAALTMPLKQRRPGRLARTVGALLLAGGASKLLKKAFPKRRPNGQDCESFPSEHAAEVVAAAASLVAQASPAVSAAGLGGAAATSLSRLPARKHYPLDIAAGMALGGLSAAATQRLARARRSGGASRP